MERVAQDDGLRAINVSSGAIEHTLELLLEYGARECECVVLWLGRRQPGAIEVVEVYRPIQQVQSHMFHITTAGMDALRDRLRAGRLMVAAQVHTHPQEAFHSEADDRWSIVRHRGALSLVVPWFAGRTAADRFFRDTKAYRLDASDEWIELSHREAQQCIQVR
jgi:proteasome lid subunit RPN8/RPN11